MNTIFTNALWVSPLFWTLALLAVAVLLFVRNKVRMDAAALLVMLAFYLSGILTTDEIFAGFSDPNIILIALLFIVGEGLVRTGIAYQVSDGILKLAGNSETKVLVLLMLAVAGLGAFMSSTGVVAIFIPVVLMICRQMNLPPKRLMMPLSVAGLISGMMTLIATAPNLVVNAELIKDTGSRLRFFDFTPIGLVILLLGIGYMLLIRRWLGTNIGTEQQNNNQRSMAELIDEYGLRDRTKRFVVRPGSPFIGKNLNELNLRSNYGLNVLAIERWKRFRPVYTMPLSSSEIHEKDILMIDIGQQNFDLAEFCQNHNLEPAEIKPQSFNEQAKSIGMAELTLVPGSSIIDKTTAEVEFRSRYGLNVVGIKREGELISDSFTGTPYKLGDLILVIGDWKFIQQMRSRTNDFVVLSYPKEMDRVAPAQSQAPQALISVLVMVALMVSGIVPNVIAALIACLMLGYFRCVDAKSAYDSIHWPSLILIIGMMPFAAALQKTGGINLAVEAMLGLVGNWGMHLVLMMLFIFCAVVGLFISNTATAILVAPIAISLAQQLNVSPIPFAMIVAIAASAAFMTPVSSPVNTMVLGPGGYKFSDFLKIGVPFTLLVMLVSVFLIPLLFPF
ncbi:SLC13 family permease [Rodentibacter haemolyticus]|uniref:SLC13 family permease n=1 Tax=Rodentibacter haemolyticus TaxID=2778911 RepID=A0ABX6V139_9PAST|nr:SLC13 family permease [Rodentibacter haemolyticus]QPB43439.1 SLC13 family permease [Rodentibacter haemolyticus]